MRINKIIVTFLITIIFCSKTTSQEGLPIYSDYLSDNFYLLFPSMAGVSNCTKLRFTGRKQWMDQDKSPNLQTLSINVPTVKNASRQVIRSAFVSTRQNTSKSGKIWLINVQMSVVNLAEKRNAQLLCIAFDVTK